MVNFNDVLFIRTVLSLTSLSSICFTPLVKAVLAIQSSSRKERWKYNGSSSHLLLFYW